MKNKNYVNIVLTGDENYVMPMGVAMYSIIKNLSRDKIARFFLLVSGWDETHEKQIRKLNNCEINIIPVEPHLHHFKNADVKKFKLDYIKSLVPYYRLLIPVVLPDYVAKIVYFDADMVADADLSKIYDEVPEDKLMAAVIELVANAHKDTVLSHLKQWPEFSKFNKDSFSAPYFNAGFFLMNLNLAREMNIFDDFMAFLSKHANPPYADQDTLNAICGQKYTEKMWYLEPAWNVFADMCFSEIVYGRVGYPHYLVRQAFANPYIYHYAGPNKPWVNSKSAHFFDIWHNYFMYSPFVEKLPKLATYYDENAVKISWVKILGLPVLKIKKSTDGREYKSYLFGILPICRKYTEKIKLYFLGIPALKIKYNHHGELGAVYLFHFLPILRVQDKADA